MAPGGRMWSESPVRGPEPRVRRVGAVAGPVAVPPDSYTSGAVEGQWSADDGLGGDPAVVMTGSYAIAESVVVAVGLNVEGWGPLSVDFEPAASAYTLVASGNAAAMRWAVWRAPWTVPFGGLKAIRLPVITTSNKACAMAWAFGWNGGDAPPLQVESVVGVGAAGMWPAIPTAPGWFSPWQLLIGAPTSGEGDASNVGNVLVYPSGLTPNFNGTGIYWDPDMDPGLPRTTNMRGSAALSPISGTIADESGSAANTWLGLVLGWYGVEAT